LTCRHSVHELGDGVGVGDDLEDLHPTAALGADRDIDGEDSRSLFAHCIHLSDDDWDRLAERRACVAHCPDSNFFLGSGVMPLAAATSRGVRTSLVTLLVDA